MSRLEPGDPAFAALILDPAKADEGLHLVAGATDILRPLHGVGDIAVGDDVEQGSLPL